MNLCDAMESRSPFRRTEHLGPNYFGLAAQCDSQGYVFVLIHLLESINVFGTRIHYHQFYFCHSVLLFSVRFAAMLFYSPAQSLHSWRLKVRIAVLRPGKHSAHEIRQQSKRYNSTKLFGAGPLSPTKCVTFLSFDSRMQETKQEIRHKIGAPTPQNRFADLTDADAVRLAQQGDAVALEGNY